MPSTITPFGIFHTAVSLLPIGFGLYAYARNGKIDPRTQVGKLYLVTMLIGCVTGLGIFHHGGFGPGHVLSIVTILFLFLGTFAERIGWFGRGAAYVETISLSTTFMLLMFFLTTETLTRLPAEHPFAPSQEAPELLPVRLTLLVAFLAGIGYQVYRLRAAKRA